MDVVLDVDTGVDDALALLLAARSPALTLRAVTCVAGNVDVDAVVANTLAVLDAAGAPEVPVARGMARPLVEPPRGARHVHGDDGLGGVGLPTSSRRPVGEHAVELLRRTILEAPGPVTLVSLGPLTNIAVLVRMYPEVVTRLDRVVAMAGAAGPGNATASAEFNVWTDPEAAAVVFGAPLPLTMYGLEVFYDVTVSRDEAHRLAGADDPGRRLAGRLLLHQAERFGADHATVGDAGAVAAVVDPAGLVVRRHPVRVELAGSSTRGRTVVDQRPDALDRDHDPLGPTAAVDVAVGVDAARYRSLFLDTLSGRG